MRSAGAIFAGIAMLGWAACIAGDQREAVDTADTTTATDTDDADSGVSDGATGTGTGVEDTGVVESDNGSGGGDGVTSSDAEVVEPSCDTDEDCIVPRVAVAGCSRTWCDDGRCRTDTWAPGDPCDDGNACTVDDHCAGGACTGDAPTCDDAQCAEVVGCDPATGCVYEPLPAETECDDGTGVPAAECVDGWYGPTDTCDGQGTCVGGSFDPPGGGFPLDGDWYTVISSGVAGGLDTLRARLAISASGELSVSGAQSSASIWSTGMSGLGFACVAPDGRVDLGRGVYNFSGSLGTSGDVVIFGGYQAGELGVAIRPGGSAADLDGTYFMVSTASLAPQQGVPQLVTWTALLTFSEGCLTTRSGATTVLGLAGLAPFWFAPTDGTCAVDDAGLVSLPLRLVASDTADPSTTGMSITWRGALEKDGGMAVLTRDGVSGSTPIYGTILLVRVDAGELAQLFPSSFALVAQRGGASATNATNSEPFVEWGEVDLPSEDAAPVSGWLGGADDDSQDITDGWYHLTLAGPRYSHRLILAGETVHETGWVHERGDLVAGFVAPPVSAVASPRDLTTTPAEGSLFLMVSPARWDFPGVEPR